MRMKSLYSKFYISLLAVLIVSCSEEDEPDYPTFMQPSSISTKSTDCRNQTFEYDQYGRITQWTNKVSEHGSVIAKYSYPAKNIIKVESEEISYNTIRLYTEMIELINNRASESEGTFIIKEDNGHETAHKSYRLKFEYDTANHLTIVKHSEIMGIGDEISSDAWNNSWDWENYLIWEDGNLKEYEDFNGSKYVYITNRFEYTSQTASYPIIYPNVINSSHHTPLLMQGIFGRNSYNLLQSSSLYDKDDNLYLSTHYNYEIHDGIITNYSEKRLRNSVFTSPIYYTVNWTPN